MRKDNQTKINGEMLIRGFNKLARTYYSGCEIKVYEQDGVVITDEDDRELTPDQLEKEFTESQLEILASNAVDWLADVQAENANPEKFDDESTASLYLNDYIGGTLADEYELTKEQKENIYNQAFEIWKRL